MKTSLVIQATNGNFSYLKCILSHYRDGTIKPDQVVISLSNAHLVKKKQIEDLEKKFEGVFKDLKILQHNKVMVQGPNRDAASMAADHEIIISNDADDIPHPQRIEVIKYFFENYDIMHLNHSYQTKNETTFVPVNPKLALFLNPEQTFYHHFPNYKGEPHQGRRPDPRLYGYMCHAYGWQPRHCAQRQHPGVSWGYDVPTHAGCPAFHKDVFKELRWRQTEDHAWDWDFVLDVLFHFRKSIIIDSKLLWYNLSGDRRDTSNALGLGSLYRE